MNIQEELNKYCYIYLHGFASSPKSSKAEFFVNEFKKYDIEVLVPNLNQNDFYNLTLTRQINQIKDIIATLKKPIVLFGASMGGVTSAILAETEDKISKNILFAPAFNITSLWDRDYNHNKINEWRDKQSLTVFHYGEKKELQLHYNFYLDLLNYKNSKFSREITTLIYHGTLDNVVPLDVSEEYIKTNQNAKLVVLEDDHGLSAFLPDILPQIIDFIILSK
jgi:predicted esterase YcpF (UPF0227 family)